MSPSPRLDSPPPPSAPTGASSRLILLADTDDGDPFQEYTTDEEDDNENNDAQLGTNQLPVPPLSSAVVFLYLLSPYLRLGAIYASDIGSAPLAYGLPGLVVAATLSAFCRQIWFLLGRYVRKSSTEDILVHMIARRRRRVSNHGWAAYTFTIFGGLFRILLAAMYLRGWCMHHDHMIPALMFPVQRFRRLCAPPQTPRIYSNALSPQCFSSTMYRGICTLSP